jgi:hypothetical protein
VTMQTTSIAHSMHLSFPSRMLRGAGLALVIGVLFSMTRASATEMIISDGGGFDNPQSITPVPLGFGPPGAAYIIPNGGNGDVYTIGAGGGTPTLLTPTPVGVGSSGGTFLPSNYGSLGGEFLDLGLNPGPGPGGLVATATAISSSGVATTLVANFTQGGNNQLNSAIVAPAGFGSVGGQVLIDASGGTHIGDIYALSTDGSTLTPFATIGTGLYGIGFAPTGFGAFGGDLFASAAFAPAPADTANIYAIAPNGNVSVFATVPTPTAFVTGQITGLRQLAFAPAGYGNYGGDLFVSVSGSQFGAFGSGPLGEILVFNDNGTEIADVDEGTLIDPLDPRGLYFADANTLLVANSDPGIDSLTPSSFSPVPEPATLLIMFTAFGLLGLMRKFSDVQS